MVREFYDKFERIRELLIVEASLSQVVSIYLLYIFTQSCLILIFY